MEKNESSEVIKFKEDIERRLSNEKGWKKITKEEGVRLKVKENSYMSDLIDDEYLEWKQGRFVCLIGSTGCGKNYFIEKNYYHMQLGMVKMSLSSVIELLIIVRLREI